MGKEILKFDNIEIKKKKQKKTHHNKTPIF